MKTNIVSLSTLLAVSTKLKATLSPVEQVETFDFFPRGRSSAKSGTKIMSEVRAVERTKSNGD